MVRIAMATMLRFITLLVLAVLLWTEVFRDLSSISLMDISDGTLDNPNISKAALGDKARRDWTGVPGLIQEENSGTIFRYKYGNRTGESICHVEPCQMLSRHLEFHLEFTNFFSPDSIKRCLTHV